MISPRVYAKIFLEVIKLFVYTFWEPRENIPFYLRLCMETWKKYLPNATIVVLDYKNIGEFIDVRELGLNLFSGKFSLALIADAIRVALLAKHGGVWMDVDTIILNSNAEKYFLPDEKHRTVFFGDTEEKSCHVAFINTPPKTVCFELWREFIREKIWNSNNVPFVNWDFLANSFIDDYAKKYSDEIKILDANLVVPERKLISFSTSAELAYLNYYFFQNHHLANMNADMILLHNSWTPSEFKQIPPDKFFYVDCTMVNVLAEALGINLPPPQQISYRSSKVNRAYKKIPSEMEGNFFMHI